MDTLERLVAAIENLEKGQNNGKDLHTKAPANTNTAPLLTQPGGMFSVAGIENEAISTHVRPQGLGALLPTIPSGLDDPRFAFVTGFSDDIGNEPDFPCDDAPTGYMKGATLTAQFGRLARQTNTIEINKLLHEQRGVNTDLRLINSMLGGDVGMSMNVNNRQRVLDLVVENEMANVGIRLERLMSRLLWQGSIGNNTANGGYAEFPGLDSQIATGHVDADTNIAVPAADSLIYEFNYNSVDGTTLDIVEYLSMMEWYLRFIARRTGLEPVDWVIAMRPELWFELSAVWPCRYLTHRCESNAGSEVMVINDDTNVQMQNAMRDGMYLEINGRRYPVVEDDGIFEHTNVNNENVPAGEFASSINFVPMRVRQNFPVAYWEHIDYRGISQQIAPMGQGASNLEFWSDSGRFLWAYDGHRGCFDLQAVVEPRVVLRTPHLAGKIQHVRYSPLTHLRSPYPDSPYFADGGTSLRDVPESFHVW